MSQCFTVHAMNDDLESVVTKRTSFTNFSPDPVDFRGKYYPTAEHRKIDHTYSLSSIHSLLLLLFASQYSKLTNSCQPEKTSQSEFASNPLLVQLSRKRHACMHTSVLTGLMSILISWIPF